MAIQGGVVLGTIAGYWYLRKNNIDFWAFADLFAPALILAQSVGRMANLLNGDAFVILRVVIMVLSILKVPLRTAPTAINHYGLRKYGKVRSIFLSLLPFYYLVPSNMLKVKYLSYTLLSTLQLVSS